MTNERREDDCCCRRATLVDIYRYLYVTRLYVTAEWSVAIFNANLVALFVFGFHIQFKFDNYNDIIENMSL